MRILALATAIVISHLPAIAQSHDRIEVWGLHGETQDEFAARHRARTGHGLDGACMATLKGEMGYTAPGVYVFPNPDAPDSTTMLVSIGDVPLYAFPMTVNERRSIALPESWNTIREFIAKERAGYVSTEFQIASPLLTAYRRGDSASVAQQIASKAAMFAAVGVSLDGAKVERILAALVEAGSAPVELTVDIYMHSDSLAYRTLAAHVLRNHLDDARAIDAFARSLWNKELGGDARTVLTSTLRSAREANIATARPRVGVPFDGALVAAMLNHPNPELCDLALELLASDPQNTSLVATGLGGGATTLKYFLRSKLTKHSEYARNFRADAIAALRRVSEVDHGADPEAWIAWIDSFGTR